MNRSEAIQAHSNVALFVAMNAVVRALPYAEGTETKHVGWPVDFVTGVTETKTGWDVRSAITVFIRVGPKLSEFTFPFTTRFDKNGSFDEQSIKDEVTESVAEQADDMRAVLT